MTSFKRFGTAAFCLSMTIASAWIGVARVNACETVAGWKAELLGKSVVPGVVSPATGLASFDFTLDQPQATVTLDSTGLQDVTEIDVRRGYVGSNGPLITRLYEAKDGPLPSHLVKTLTSMDITPVPAIHIQTFADFATLIVNGGTYVVVCTKTHPEGEVRGQVCMVKQRVFSTTEDGRGHDPNLHAGAVKPASSP